MSDGIASLESLSISLDTTSSTHAWRFVHNLAPTHSLDCLESRFRFQRLLGQGGFGEVWEAFDSERDCLVALKGPRSDKPVTPERVELFLAEAEKAKNCSTTGIVKVLDVVHTHGDRPGSLICFIVMELMAKSLGDRLRSGARPTVKESVGWLKQIAETLSQLHGAGYVHRDIKPDNILFDHKERPHLSDLGGCQQL